MFRKRLFRILIGVAVVVVLLFFLRVDYVRTDSSGWLFWNKEDAYFFMGMADRGYRFSYLGYIVEQVREIYPFGASSPSDNHFSVLVLHVTPNSVQRYPIDNFWLTSIEPREGALYAGNRLAMTQLKWSGDRFEHETAEDQTKMQLAMRDGRVPPGPSYDDVEGWSKRTVAGEIVSESPTVSVEKDSKVTIEVAGKQLTFVMNSGFFSHEAYIDLIRPGQPTERIWHLDGQAHRVSRAEYDRIFKK